MTLPVLLGLGLAGGLGALARVAVAGVIAARVHHSFPLWTLAVNLSGAFALGVLVGAAPSADVLRVAGTGLLGAYTTFSAWMLESQRLAEDGERGRAVANLLVSLALGLLLAWAGRALGQSL